MSEASKHGELIGRLADLSEDEWQAVKKAVWDIRLAKKQEVTRTEDRERFAVLEAAFSDVGMSVIGLEERGRGKRLVAVWPKGRRPHLLRLHGGRLFKICGGGGPLEDLQRVELEGWGTCHSCLTRRFRSGFWRGFAMNRDAIQARSIERTT